MAEKICHTCMNLWNTMKIDFHHQEINKNNTYISTWCLIFNLCKKCRFLQKIIFCILSSTLIGNARHVPKAAFARYFLDKFRNPRKLHVACQNLSQMNVTKTLRPI